MSSYKGQIERDCTEKCKSIQHGDNLSMVISKRGVSDPELCSYLRYKCSACGQVLDSRGRNALHLAASCGRMNLIKWLVQNKGAAINLKDQESGYTALHRSIFYGKINCAIALMKQGAQSNILDFEDLSPIELAIKDRLPNTIYNLNSPCQAYVWGSNINYTLGIGSQQTRQFPELHESFHKKYPELSIKQICLKKFHCVIVTTDGRVFTCGHGQGGRLGLNIEKTVLIPEEVNFKASGLEFSCVEASISRDHSLFLSKTGQVWSCGLNTYFVLGIKPPPPKLLVPRPLKDLQNEIKGICCGRFHSVAWGPKALYTWGVNGGQLGHDQRGNLNYITPKLVSNFLNDKLEIINVAASDGATVVSAKSGDIFVLHEYQIRKIASRQLNVQQISVIGGHLNSKISSDILTEKGGTELKVLVLETTGNLLIWHESYPQLTRCIYNIKRQLIITDAILTYNDLQFVTKDGEAFKGILKTRRKKVTESNNNNNKRIVFNDFLDKDECQMVKVTKLSNIHRAVKISCDLKGLNFAVIQNSPRFLLINVPEISKSEIQGNMLNFLNDTNEMDFIHDVIFKVENQYFPVHRYIIASQSEPLDSIIESNKSNDFIELLNINPLIFKQILIYIYSETSDLLKCGPSPIKLLQTNNNNLSDNKKIKNKPKNNINENEDPIRLFQQAAKRFGIKSLYKKLENYIFTDGFINLKTNQKNYNINNKVIKFERQYLKDLYDVVIKTENGKEIPAHKCILAARLEYFNNLLSMRWNNESSKRSEIQMKIPYNIMETVIEFLYTDDAKDLRISDDVEFISNVLITADELFIERLKEICEVSLCNCLSLKNATQMLQFSCMFNAKQLKNSVMEFICLNLSQFLENRNLENLENEILNDLTEYYFNFNQNLSKRVLTPYSDAPSDEEVKNIYELYPINIEDVEIENEKKCQKLCTKRKTRTRKSSNSDSSKKCETSFSEISETKINNKSFEENSSKPDESWTKIVTEKEKYKKIVQNRLSLINQSTIENESNFTILTKTIPINTTKNENSNKSPLTSPKCPSFSEFPIEKLQKLSQKQRKKLNYDTNTTTKMSPTTQIQIPTINNINKPCWNTILTSKNNNSFADIMKNEIKSNKSKEFPELSAGSSTSTSQKNINMSPVVSPETKNSFVDIVADERKLKENWSKMRDRPLIYIQMEDKAINDLERFYNIDQVSEEYITIHKVDRGGFTVPLWAHSNTKH